MTFAGVLLLRVCTVGAKAAGRDWTVILPASLVVWPFYNQLLRFPAGHKLQVVLVPTAKDAAALLACSQAWKAQTWGGRLRIWALQQLQARDVSQKQRCVQAKFKSGMGHQRQRHYQNWLNAAASLAIPVSS